MIFDVTEERMHTVQEAAKFLGVTEEAVLSLIHRCELPASNLNTKPNAQRPRWRILASDLGRFLLKTRQQKPPENKPVGRRKKSSTTDHFAAALDES